MDAPGLRSLLTAKAGWLARVDLTDFWPRPRIRRPVDVSRFVLSVSVLAVLVTLAVVDGQFLDSIAALIPGLPSGSGRTALSLVNIVLSLGVVAVLLAITIDALRSRRFALTSAVLSVALALSLAVAVVFLISIAGDSAAISPLVGPPTESAGLPVTATVAAVVGADLQRSRLRAIARLVIAAAVGCAVALGGLPLPSAAYAVLIGSSVGLGVRVFAGVVPARPALELIRSELDRAGWRVPALLLLHESAGRATYQGVDGDEQPLKVTVVDRDRRGVPFARRAWRLARLRTAAVGRPALSLRGQLERQALSAALAQAAHIAAPRSLALLSVGPALVLVERPPVGSSFLGAPHSAAVAGYTAAAGSLRRLHDAGIAHCALTAHGIVRTPDGEVAFSDLSAAQPASTELQRDLDVVALLVATASEVDAAHAATAIRSGYRTTPAMEARFATLLQPVALPRSTRRSLKGGKLLNELRAALTSPEIDVATVAHPRLERVKTRTIVTVVGGTAAAYILATQLSQVSLVDALRPQKPAWLALALVGSALTYLGSALVKQAFFPLALPLGRTALVQLASSFVALVTPPAVGHVGLNIRYLQRAGVPVAIAAATIGVSEGITVAVTLLLLLACAWLSGVSGSQLSLLPSGTVVIVLIAAAAVLGIAAALPTSRRLIRRQLEPILRRTLPQLLEMASDPRRLGVAVFGVLVMNGGYILALDASLRAYEQSVSLPVLVVVYLASSTIGSAVPTPGGIGAVEAALVAGLSTAGVPVAGALTAVLAFRGATFWLPAPIGWGVFVALQRRHRL